MAANEIVLRVRLDSSGAARGFQQIEQSARSLGSNLLSVFGGDLLANAFRSGLSAANSFFETSIKKASQLQSALLGLSSIATFKGIDAGEASEAVKGLDLVKNGLLTVGEASAAMKNLLSKGFSLSESQRLITALGDSAAFGRQAALDFGQAVVGATEGIKNNNSALVDNAGLQANVAALVARHGFEMGDLDDKTKGAAARAALFTEILAETAGQAGDAAKFATTAAGGLSKFEAAISKIQTAIGTLILTNPDVQRLFGGLIQVADGLVRVAEGGEAASKVQATISAIITTVEGAVASIPGVYEKIREGFNANVVPVVSGLAGIVAEVIGYAYKAASGWGFFFDYLKAGFNLLKAHAEAFAASIARTILDAAANVIDSLGPAAKLAGLGGIDTKTLRKEARGREAAAKILATVEEANFAITVANISRKAKSLDATVEELIHSIEVGAAKVAERLKLPELPTITLPGPVPAGPDPKAVRVVIGPDGTPTLTGGSGPSLLNPTPNTAGAEVDKIVNKMEVVAESIEEAGKKAAEEIGKQKIELKVTAGPDTSVESLGRTAGIGVRH